MYALCVLCVVAAAAPREGDTTERGAAPPSDYADPVGAPVVAEDVQAQALPPVRRLVVLSPPLRRRSGPTTTTTTMTTEDVLRATTRTDDAAVDQGWAMGDEGRRQQGGYR
eukprot:GHVU01032241.1.p1 GENE.GHVU01032241.1~~GHVU01032241.1.p1  ORF type:complete len:111 (-),score=24.92 GHVU01032241.1:76-408(-)